MTEAINPVPPDSVWREKRTGRLIKVIGDYDPPAWTYVDENHNPVPHGYEPANGHTYGGWYEHRCDIFDFVVWERFERVI